MELSRAMVFGWAGLASLLASWAVFWLPHSMLPRHWAQWLYLLAIILSGPAAIILGIIAGRTASKWWYFVAVAGFLTVGILVAGLAV